MSSRDRQEDAAPQASRMNAVLRAGIVEAERKQSYTGMMMDVDPSEEELLSAYTKALREFESASSELKKATNEAINTTKTRKSSPDNPHAKLAAANAQIAKQKATETYNKKAKAKDAAAQALDKRNLGRPAILSTASTTKKLTADDLEKLRERFKVERPDGNDVEFEPYYATFRSRFPTLQFDPYYAQFKIVQDKREIGRLKYIKDGGNQKVYEIRYGRLNENHDSIVANWLATNPGKSFADAEKDPKMQEEYAKAIAAVSKYAEDRALQLSRKEMLTEEQRAELKHSRRRRMLCGLR